MRETSFHLDKETDTVVNVGTWCPGAIIVTCASRTLGIASDVYLSTEQAETLCRKLTAALGKATHVEVL